MRMTDHLQTETPRPVLDDPVFTGFNDMYCEPTVIDGTDVMSLFMEMTLFQEMEGMNPPSEGQGGVDWQVDQLYDFDFRTLGCVAPPFNAFVIEFDVREAMMKANDRLGGPLTARSLADVGQTCAAFSIMGKEVWTDTIAKDYMTARPTIGPTMKEVDDLDFTWMYCVTTYRKNPGKGLRGPLCTWLIPVDHDGHLYMSEITPSLLAASALGPHVDYGDDMHMSRNYALTQGWSVIVPALLALSFLHTPRTDKKREGYHDLVPAESNLPARQQRKYLERNFRPLTKWHTLDISPLRRAVTEAHGGRMPTSWKGLAKALHVVRGHTATYMPNTYFGQKHDRPITVFRPSYKRGDVKAGVVSKEYRLNTEETA